MKQSETASRWAELANVHLHCLVTLPKINCCTSILVKRDLRGILILPRFWGGLDMQIGGNWYHSAICFLLIVLQVWELYWDKADLPSSILVRGDMYKCRYICIDYMLPCYQFSCPLPKRRFFRQTMLLHVRFHCYPDEQILQGLCQQAAQAGGQYPSDLQFITENLAQATGDFTRQFFQSPRWIQFRIPIWPGFLLPLLLVGCYTPYELARVVGNGIGDIGAVGSCSRVKLG